MCQLFSSCTAQQVLDHLRDRFIKEVDAAVIVRELEYQGIISDGVQKEVAGASGRTVQNQILHAHLVRTCTKEALVNVSEVISAVEGNPVMRALGADMKSMLKGECGVFMCTCTLHVCAWCAIGANVVRNELHQKVGHHTAVRVWCLS